LIQQLSKLETNDYAFNSRQQQSFLRRLVSQRLIISWIYNITERGSS